MTDLEITKLCAEAMGEHINSRSSELMVYVDDGGLDMEYNPLHNDAQAMALVKKLSLFIECRFFADEEESQYWNVFQRGYGSSQVMSKDLNRAICECVAKMQATKPAP